MSRLVALADFALFQLAWFACASAAAHQRPAAGVAAVVAFVLLQLVRSTRRTADAALIAGAIALGLVWDTALLQAGLVRYAAAGPVAGVAPGWILAMWALFAAILRGPLAWLQRRPLVAAALGAIGGPASYAAAARLGACSLPDRALAFAVLAAGWMVFTPLLVEAARRLERGPLPLKAVQA